MTSLVNEKLVIAGTKVWEEFCAEKDDQGEAARCSPLKCLTISESKADVSAIMKTYLCVSVYI